MSDMALATIERLRAIVRIAANGALTISDGQWLAGILNDYLERARDGATLDDAFGLAVAAGADPWWQIEARDGRRAALREFYDRYCKGPTERGRLVILQAELRRYARMQWMRDRSTRAEGGWENFTTLANLPRELLFRAFVCHESMSGTAMPSSIKQLRRILATHSELEGKLGHDPALLMSRKKVQTTGSQSKEANGDDHRKTEVPAQRRRGEGGR